VEAIALSPDGKRLASASSAGNAKLWNLEDGKQLAETKSDLRTTLKAAELARAASLAKKHIDLAKKDLDEANTRKKAEEDNQKKTAEALTKAETDVKSKDEAIKKASDETAAAEKGVAEATAPK